MEKLLAVYRNKKEAINYIIFGVLTTVLSWFTCFALAYTIADITVPAINTAVNVAGWVVGVSFAYVTNRKYVFESKNDNVAKELFRFVCSRLSTLVLDIVVMYIGVNAIVLPYAPCKIFSGILVIVVNYILSKLVVFRKNS